ncbi:hypothetical protein H6G33_34615 [Calothrix sp. FACHB-1219]|uniref:hypothetical protein n=1 Tax=unclassified Calothrix TaxID=2619626 RepID=UPI001682D135|nr:MULTISPECIES: hypothetical protein [unclassified Calothrix]MBD2203703.1 hypothetical protein [Calothrix sp. FACHB-168]MBD2222075.1 hypothetical protein [Calothrix sp. FACHB-1219]
MNRLKKLSSMIFLLLAFIYPPTLAEAKDTTLNHVFNEQSIDTQTKLLGEQSEELLLAHQQNRQRYHRRQRTGRYYQHRRTRKHYYRGRYRSIRYRGQPYRHGEWQLVRDRHGRLMYDWRR